MKIDRLSLLKKDTILTIAIWIGWTLLLLSHFLPAADLHVGHLSSRLDPQDGPTMGLACVLWTHLAVLHFDHLVLPFLLLAVGNWFMLFSHWLLDEDYDSNAKVLIVLNLQWLLAVAVPFLYLEAPPVKEFLYGYWVWTTGQVIVGLGALFKYGKLEFRLSLKNDR